MQIIKFYYKWLCIAVYKSWGIATNVVAAAYFAFYHIIKYTDFYPNKEVAEAINSSQSQFLLYVLSSVFILRLLIAPYWVYKEQKKEIGELRERLFTLSSNAIFSSLKPLSIAMGEGEPYEKVNAMAGSLVERTVFVEIYNPNLDCLSNCCLKMSYFDKKNQKPFSFTLAKGFDLLSGKKKFFPVAVYLESPTNSERMNSIRLQIPRNGFSSCDDFLSDEGPYQLTFLVKCDETTESESVGILNVDSNTGKLSLKKQ